MEAFILWMKWLGAPADQVEPGDLQTAFYICAAMIFYMGASIGSFLNVCIYRFPLYGRQPWRPAFSFCFSCGTRLAGRDNLPLISYLWLMGRCRKCGAVYSSRYFWIELMSGFLFFGFFVYYGPTLGFLSAVIFASLLIVATFTDLDEYIIPDEVNIAGVVAGFLVATVAWLAPEHILTQGVVVKHPGWALAGAAVGAGVLYGIGLLGTLVFRKEAMGFGDVKLLGMMGVFIGPANVVVTLVLASFIGASVGIAQKLTALLMGKKSYAHIPFGPHLAVAGLISLFAGAEILSLVFPPGSWELLREAFFGTGEMYP
jgi:leader peptidase (prepilin peptidase) / N-methyltransferase